MTIAFIGLGNVGAKLAGSLLRNGTELIVRDLDCAAAEPLLAAGARWGDSPRAMAEEAEALITCLPSPAASRAVIEGEDGALPALIDGKLWVEMSTTDADEMRRFGPILAAQGGALAECPVSGGCHRAATGNIAIFMGGERAVFDRVLPLLTRMGRRVLHTGPHGTASTLKVMTNFLATANLVALCEALTVSAAAGMDLATTYEAIRISSGTSFVHETESQVILNGSRDVDFTAGLVLKDIGLFQKLADAADIPLDLNPLLIRQFETCVERWGADFSSTAVIRLLEEATGLDIRAPGFPATLVDEEPEAAGYEIRREA
jgi:3-hydroxyisobutyrate dehydrogenase